MATGKWESLRDASFRGVAFNLVDNEGTSGRRAIPRAYPKKEVGWTEDNGAVLGQQQINAKLVGSNYQTQLEALLKALNTSGPGELVHPWFGVQKVQVGKVTHRLSTEEGGIAYVSFEVFEAGERLFPSAAENTSQVSLSAADKVKQAFASGDYFAALDGLGDMTDTLLNDMESFVTNLPTVPSQLTDWVDRLGRFKDLAGTIIATPGQLAREITSLADNLKSVVTEQPWALRVYDQLRDKWAGERAERAATKSLPQDMQVTPGSVDSGVTGFASSVPATVITPGDAMQTNISDFQQLVSVISLVGKAETISGMDFNTSDEAISAGDQLAEELADEAVSAVEKGQRDLWRTLRDLRFAVVNDVRVRAAQLPELRRVTPSSTISVTLLAWRETGDAENRDAIVARNRLRDPSFILPTRSVEIVE